ncbi:MAG TPA: hypothetical protein VFZ09_49015 [Archangium sp.]|uniref:hypothetical protein n=1 Tax=Archangium sp. TaxID=1872627 RepID=UPI002E3611C2|nr:hypothetical protein [Archangium sp.]HEX5754221.1 hypothetical protein [Archangium sp.]
MRFIQTLPAALLSLALTLALPADAGDAPACPEVCQHLGDVCPLAATGCGFICSGVSPAERACLARAKNCDDADRCSAVDGPAPAPTAKQRGQGKTSTAAPDLTGTWRRNAGNAKVDAALELSGAGRCRSRATDRATGKPIGSLEQECTYSQSGNQFEIEYKSGLCQGIRGRYEVSRSANELRFKALEDDCHGRRMELTGGAWKR